VEFVRVLVLNCHGFCPQLGMLWFLTSLLYMRSMACHTRHALSFVQATAAILFLTTGKLTLRDTWPIVAAAYDNIAAKNSVCLHTNPFPLNIINFIDMYCDT